MKQLACTVRVAGVVCIKIDAIITRTPWRTGTHRRSTTHRSTKTSIRKSISTDALARDFPRSIVRTREMVRYLPPRHRGCTEKILHSKVLENKCTRQVLSLHQLQAHHSSQRPAKLRRVRMVVIRASRLRWSPRTHTDLVLVLKSWGSMANSNSKSTLTEILVQATTQKTFQPSSNL